MEGRERVSEGGNEVCERNKRSEEMNKQRNVLVPVRELTHSKV